MTASARFTLYRTFRTMGFRPARAWQLAYRPSIVAAFTPMK